MYGGMDMGSGMGSGMDAGMDSATGKLGQLLAQLPPWASALLMTLAVLAVGAILGGMLGRLYSSVRYPDPEKQTAIHPLMRVIFLCALMLCAVTLYRTLSQDDTLVPGEDSSMTDGSASDGASGEASNRPSTGQSGGRPMTGGGAVAVFRAS